MDFIETITAIATPRGRGGIGIIRLSGPKSLVIAQKIADAVPQPGQFIFTALKNQNNQRIDQGLVLYFKAPHSFTGEDVVEFQTHGSPIVLDILLETAVHYGARLASAGEFSERAFLNNKIDLTQAEAIADLIEATSRQAAQSAMHSLQGEFSKHIHALVETLIHLRSYIEASLDFSDEDIDFLGEYQLQNKLQKLRSDLSHIEKLTRQGVLLKEGISVVITGKPNAGKSSLLNKLSGEDVAIVTEIAGTTRDILKQEIVLECLTLQLIDTAGIRETNDRIEQEGIRRAYDATEKADVILWIMDVTEPIDEKEMARLIQYQKPVIAIFNKCDLLDETTKKNIPLLLEDVTSCRHPRAGGGPLGPWIPAYAGMTKQSSNTNFPSILFSAKTGEGIDQLIEALKKAVDYPSDTEGVFIARRRHIEALNAAQSYLEKAEIQLNQRHYELLAEELKLAQQALSQITGVFSSDDLLGSIFSSFCIGK